MRRRKRGWPAAQGAEARAHAGAVRWKREGRGHAAPEWREAEGTAALAPAPAGPAGSERARAPAVPSQPPWTLGTQAAEPEARGVQAPGHAQAEVRNTRARTQLW